jgi:hypothetical protein
LFAVPRLVEATAHHPARLRESVTTLWELAQKESDRSDSGESTKTVLKRLAAWHRFGNPALNFAMLVEAIRLTHRKRGRIQRVAGRDDHVVRRLWAQLHCRESVLDYLDFVLEGDGSPAMHAVSVMLHNFLTRVGRGSTQEEKNWQGRERERCLQAIIRRYERPASPLLKTKLYDALRSATAINCPEPVRQTATEALAKIVVEDDVAVVDAICTEQHELPSSFNRIYRSRVGTTHYGVDDEGTLQPRTSHCGGG